MSLVAFPRPGGRDDGERPSARLAPHLEPGERIEWAGRPRAFALVRDRGLIVPLWLAAIAAPLAAILLTVSTSDLVTLAGLAMLATAGAIGAIALGIARRAGETLYAITDRRVLILHDGALPRLDNAPADRIAWVEVAAQRDGTGAVHLTLTTPDGAGGDRVLAGLDDPAAVARRIVTTFGFHAPHIATDAANGAGES